MPENLIKVCHLTSVHYRYDTRIFVKMCTSLAKFNYKVSLIVADGKGIEFLNNILIIDVGIKKSHRLFRMIITVFNLYKKAKIIDADIYHLHDPELLFLGLILKNQGKKVIFDSHEDYPQQLLGKPYLNKYLKKIISKIVGVLEKKICSKFDTIIAATPFIRDKFLKINPVSIDVNNFPLYKELQNFTDWKYKNEEVVYVGSISVARGITQIVQSLEFTSGVKLNLAGTFEEKTLEIKVKNINSWNKVNELGFLSRQEIKEVLSRSRAGLVVLYPIINYLDSLPVKMFEYMAAGIPVICSDFPFWRQIISENKCGLCVDPLNIEAIGEAIQYIIDNPNEAEFMGINGRLAIENKYNWSLEEKKLLEVYKNLI